MLAITNGIAAYGGFMPFDATFFSFLTYAFGSLRVGALSHLTGVHVFTHDSIYVGEDGPTHQPVEILAQARDMPNIIDWRPAGRAEVIGSYAGCVAWQHKQHVLALTRQNVPEAKGCDAAKTA